MWGFLGHKEVWTIDSSDSGIVEERNNREEKDYEQREEIKEANKYGTYTLVKVS